MSKRCFPNGIFQIPHGVTSACDRSKTLSEGQWMSENTSLFNHFGAFCPRESGPWPPSQHITLKNTVLKHRLLPSLSRGLAATEPIAVQWVLMAPTFRMDSPFYNEFVRVGRAFAPAKDGPPCLSHGSRWVAPRSRGWGHPSAQPIETPFTENLKNYCP